jgi:hypothetical protein
MAEPATQEESEAADVPRGSLSPGIWERRANESHPARRAFEVYLGLGDDRSLRLTAEQVGCHLSLIKRWSSQHEWRRRVGAWDASRRHEVATQAAIQQAAYERRQRNAEQLEKFAMAGLRSLLERDAESGELRFVEGLKAAEIAALIRVACQMMPTPPPPVQEEGEEGGVLSELSDAELMRVRTLLQGEQSDEQRNAAGTTEQAREEPPGDGGGG